MDFNERLEQMRQEMEQRRKELEERIYRSRSQVSSFPPRKEEAEVPQVQKKVEKDFGGLTRLEYLEGLEDDSETKIGNFEKLIPSYLDDLGNPEKKFASFGYSDDDLAPIINLLTAIVEIEFNAFLLERLQGWGITPMKKNWATLGDLSKVYDNEEGKKYLKSVFATNKVNFKDSHEQFCTILRRRNDANHAGVITLDCFIRFYNTSFVPFYNNTIKAILPHKSSGNHPKEAFSSISSSFANPVASFSEAAYQEQLSHLFEEEQSDTHTRTCIIFTNTDQLALKYYGGINEKIEFENGQEIEAIRIVYGFILSFIQQATKENVRYYLLDVANNTYGHLLDNERSWRSHLMVLDSYCRQNKISENCPLGLFILGGDDVIPMPRLKNPNVTALNNANKIDVLESTLEVDWLYSFPSKNIVVSSDGYLEYESLAGASPRFHVSRLPLETGLMETKFENDVDAYLNRDLQELSQGIDVKTFTLVACDSAKKVANIMVDGMPVTAPPQLMEEGCIHENAFVSPQLSLESGNSEAFKEYAEQLEQTDLLTFILHGGHHPNMPEFFGEQVIIEGEYAYKHQTPAFSPIFFHNLPTKVVVPICCWGGRFINYRREKSALLSAIHSNALLFLGSCRSALGAFDHLFSKDEPVRIACAEILQRLFLGYLLTGHTAGEALSLAKSTYLNNLTDPDSSDLLTVLEFNLFGDPMLRVKPLLSENDIVCDSPQETSITLPNFKAGTFSVTTSILYDSDNNDLLARVRNLVDSNLNDIRNRLNSLLPKKYGVDPSTLRRIEKRTQPHKKDSYRFLYTDKEKEELTTYVFTNLDGEITKIIGTI